MLKRLIFGLIALLLMLVLILLANTFRQGSRQIDAKPIAPLALDTQAIAESMAAAVKAKTVTGLQDPTGLAAEYEALHKHLQTRYPLVHQHLQREVIGSHSLLYTWQGSDSTAKPVALLAHQDVVPIAPGTESLWKQPPFGGVIADGHVWGRGTLDDKSNLITLLEAVESLLQAGVKPKRTLMLFFGHDEEVGGQQGAVKAVELLKQRKIQLEFVLDEGMAITEGVMPGVKAPVALIGLAEKGAMSLKLTAKAAPGHSSMPPAAAGSSAIGMLSAALAKLEQNQVPGGIRGVAGEMFMAVAPELPLSQRVPLSNLWLFRPVVESMLAKGNATNAMMRTTTALTIVNAGNKYNVLPGEATAVVNFRLLPGDSSASIIEHVKKVIADARIDVQALEQPHEASRISSANADGFKTIERTIREVFPEAIVSPGLVLAGTDSRHFEGVADNVYRFMPIRFTSPDLQRVHGTDERIAVEQLAQMVRFYRRLMQTVVGAS